MPREYAQITPSVVRWARERAKLTIDQVADKLGRPPTDILKWENGEALPTLAQARNAAKLYGRAFAVFYLPTPPDDFEPLRDFRMNQESEISTKSLSFIRHAQWKAEWLADFLESDGSTKLNFVGSYSVNSPVEDVASSIMDTLGISLSEHIATRSHQKALSLWINKTERCGINVLRDSSIKSDEFRGFVIINDYSPFVFLNSNDSYASRIFTLVHELVHIWINQQGIVDPLVFNRVSNASDVEKYCNRVAQAVLIDKIELLKLWDSTKDITSIVKTCQDISNAMVISPEMIARFLMDSKRISRADYQAVREAGIELWKKHKEKQRESEGIVSPSLMAALKNGYLFSHIVLNAYQTGLISGRDASSLLNYKVNNFGKLFDNIPMRSFHE
jgi:Zn-dependent peptidase ImmA (M78 family)/DNA-binding XRE family transcriptional regulator